MTIKKIISLMFVVLMMTTIAAPVLGAANRLITGYGEHEFGKVTNPESGTGMPDGINTNDITGYAANRYNSYAWAMSERDGYIYIGTNRNLFGSALSAVARGIAAAQGTSVEEAQETMMNFVQLFAGSDIPDPREMTEEDWIPQIIKLDPQNGTTQVIYQPDMTGVNPATEIASFRSAVKFNDCIYFGSLGNTRLQLVKVDKNDSCSVVYEANATGSSLRAGCEFNGTLVFGGQDSTLPTPEGIKPIVIRMMNPDDDTDWSNIIADYRDFMEYADETVYAAQGGSVWDLVSYNDTLYLVLATDQGFALYRGEEAPSSTAANDYGWVWTPIVGEGGKYNVGMASTPDGLNTDTIPGTYDSTATPYVFNGKLYLGTFDWSTQVLIRTVTLMLQRFGDVQNGPRLSQIFRMLYDSTMHPQTLYVMDENEDITVVDGLTGMLSQTNTEYIWRMIEFNGKLYASTYDPTVVYDYFVDYGRILDLINFNDPDYIQSEYIDKLEQNEKAISLLDEKSGVRVQLQSLNERLSRLILDVSERKIELDEFYYDLVDIDRELDALRSDGICEDIRGTFDGIVDTLDLEGLGMIIRLHSRYAAADAGFDLYASADGENWEALIIDGCADKYNYGGRTLAICNGSLYVGTANPFYGAQVWEYLSEQESSVLPGDVNLDGRITSADALLTLRYSIGLADLTEEQLLAADVNSDASINSADALVILRMSLGI